MEDKRQDDSRVYPCVDCGELRSKTMDVLVLMENESNSFSICDACFHKRVRTENKLLCCPFCGEEAYILDAMIIRGYRVSCNSDCVSMPSRADMAFSSIEQAREAWNKRAKRR